MASLYKWEDFVTKNYAAQAKAFLNAYWEEVEGKAEDVWKWAHKFIELDQDNAEEGSDLDEFGAHRFLESIGETKTVKEMRKQLKETDLDFNKRIALLEYCLWSAGKGINDFLKRPQGDASEVDKCQKLLEEVQAALKEATAKADAARAADTEATKTAKAAKTRDEAAAAAAADAKEKETQAAKDAAEAKETETQAASDAAVAKAAADELRAALAELKAQEDAYNTKTETLKKKSEQGGVVTRNKAKAELEIHLAEDPLPLRTAKITQEAATRKAEKTQAAADASHADAVAKRTEADASHAAAVAAREEAVAAAEAAATARAEAEAAAEAAAAARAEADSALDACMAKYKEAEEALAEAKKNAGPGQGNVWWVERELHEAKKYMPLRKGGIARK